MTLFQPGLRMLSIPALFNTQLHTRDMYGVFVVFYALLAHLVLTVVHVCSVHPRKSRGGLYAMRGYGDMRMRRLYATEQEDNEIERRGMRGAS